MAASSRMIPGSSRIRARSFMAQPFKHSSGVYYLRRRVPEELRPSLGLEYKRSLKTRDPGEAKARFAAEWGKSEEAFSLARAQLSGMSALTARDIQQLAARWFRAELEQLERTGDFKPFLVQGSLVSNEGPGGHQEFQEWISLRDAPTQGIELDPFDMARPYVLRTLKAEAIARPAPDSQALKDLAQAFWTHLLQLSDLAKLRHDGDWVTRYNVMEPGPLSVKSPTPNQGKTLLEAFSAYKESKLLDDGDSRSTIRTLDEFGSTIRRFVELLGDLPLSAVTRATIQEYRAYLAKFPTKAKGAAKLSAQQLIAKAETEQLPTLSAATVGNKLRALSAVLGFAVRMDWIKENAVEASGIARAAKRTANNSAKRRKDYSQAELRQIFTSPVFVDPNWRLPRRDFGRAFYWLPLLMYYTGARREELAQLAARDVITDEAGIPCLSILATLGDDDRGRTVKNYGSRRRVPLHDHLIELGFLGYAADQPTEGQLFPLLACNSDGYYGVNWGKAWARYLRETTGLESPASPSHGFRHSFKTLSRQAGITEEVHDAITGHSNGTVGRSYGSMPLARIAEELRKLPKAPIP